MYWKGEEVQENGMTLSKKDPEAGCLSLVGTTAAPSGLKFNCNYNIFSDPLSCIREIT